MPRLLRWRGSARNDSAVSRLPYRYPLPATRYPLPATRYPLPATRYFPTLAFSSCLSSRLTASTCGRSAGSGSTRSAR
jgi:hypothetical protein